MLHAHAHACNCTESDTKAYSNKTHIHTHNTHYTHIQPIENKSSTRKRAKCITNETYYFLLKQRQISQSKFHVVVVVSFPSNLPLGSPFLFSFLPSRYLWSVFSFSLSLLLSSEHRNVSVLLLLALAICWKSQLFLYVRYVYFVLYFCGEFCAFLLRAMMIVMEGAFARVSNEKL